MLQPLPTSQWGHHFPIGFSSSGMLSNLQHRVQSPQDLGFIIPPSDGRWRPVLERDPYEKLGLVLAAVEAAVLIKEMLRAPARVTDLRGDVQDERMDVESEAEHEARGGFVLQF